MFNSEHIIPENDPIYEDSVKLVTALAIHVSSRLGRKVRLETRRCTDLRQHEVHIEVWRVLASSKVIFAGIGHHPAEVAS